jgi:alkylation response protein AidB-like acyl-CoA dehydrogenase
VPSVRLSDSRAESRFRAELATWLDENQPAADRASDPPRSPGHIPGWASDWQRTLFDAGWLVPRWPAELGGRDASAIEQMIYLEELSRRRVPRTVNPTGLDVCAPTLVEHGAGTQREQWVPATLHGRLSWCVAVDNVATDGSGDAPESTGDDVTAGTALAAHEQDGDLVVRGGVPAPPGAAHADRCLCAVHVEPGRGRLRGVAVLAVDLAAEGVSRPGASEAGDDGEQSRLSFDDVVLDNHDIVGEHDQGWPVLQSVRARMRSVRWITSLLAIERALEALTDVGLARGLTDDAVFRDTLAGLQVDADAVRALAYRALAKQASGRPNPELAMLPLVTREAEQRIYISGLEALGADGLDLAVEGPMPWPSGSWASEWLGATADDEGKGGLGAERDRVAARVLGLPLR